MKHIVILGAGFGGLRTAIDINRGIKKSGLSDYQVILVNRTPCHIFTPVLYEVATVEKRYFDRETLQPLAAYTISKLLEGTSVVFKEDEVFRIDLEECQIHLKSGKIAFDYLVLALGAETTYFNIPGLQENSFQLKTFEDAFSIRNKLEELINKTRSGKNVRIVVGGAGSTGIELSAEIVRFFDKFSRNTEVVLLEAMSSILPGFDHDVIKKIENRLHKIGVKIITNKPVAALSFKEAKFRDDSSMAFDLFVWTGGVGASPLTRELPLKIRKEEKNRLEIVGDLGCLPGNTDLKVTGSAYAIGDIACIFNPKSKRMVPLVARAAIDQGRIVAKNILEKIRLGNNPINNAQKFLYAPKEYPYLIPVGGKFAILKIGPIVISGFLGWIFKLLIELNYLRSIMPLWAAKKLWLKMFKVFNAND